MYAVVTYALPTEPPIDVETGLEQRLLFTTMVVRHPSELTLGKIIDSAQCIL